MKNRQSNLASSFYRICTFFRATFHCVEWRRRLYFRILHLFSSLDDDRVGNALLLVSLIVGGIMGAISLIFVATTDWFDSAGSGAKAVAFFIGFCIGLAVCSILLSTVASGVNTVIVMVSCAKWYLRIHKKSFYWICSPTLPIKFADSPAELQQNYPEISQKMRRIWGELYPGSV